MKILFVDAGNYSRSPAAEVIAKTQSERKFPTGVVEFSSAGLKDKHVGGPADPRTIEECSRRGYDLSAFRCRQIGPRDFARFNRILAMDRSNFEALIAMRPPNCRAQIDLMIPQKEVPDPYFGGEDGFVVAIDLIERRIAELLDEIVV